MFGGRVSMEAVAPVLQRAFRQPGLKAVALEINSPGGSAAQSALIHNRIRALAAERDVPVMAFVEDVAASGGYWLAAAADEIFVDDNSILGSIGVIYSGFGFHEAIAKLGVERRLYTAGEKKSLLDPFLAVQPDDLDRLRRVQGDIHDNFKESIRARRGARLAESEPDLFSGEFWLGRKAIGLGLADGIGDIRSVLRERYGRKVVIRKIGRPRGWLARAPAAGPPARRRRWRGGRLARRRPVGRDRSPPPGGPATGSRTAPASNRQSGPATGAPRGRSGGHRRAAGRRDGTSGSLKYFWAFGLVSQRSCVTGVISGWNWTPNARAPWLKAWFSKIAPRASSSAPGGRSKPSRCQ